MHEEAAHMDADGSYIQGSSVRLYLLIFADDYKRRALYVQIL